MASRKERKGQAQGRGASELAFQGNGDWNVIAKCAEKCFVRS